jgi:electron transport complex protein RnfB
MQILIDGLFVALVVGAIGAVIGLVLAFASKVFHVKEDPRYELIVANLPGFNCGACGYAGCSGMAEGLLAGDADVTNCTPGTALTYAKVKAILNGEDPDKVTDVKEPKKPAPRKKLEIVDVTNDDPRFNKIVELLPALNCTTCGEPGCKAFADALLKGKKTVADCRPLNRKQEQKAEIEKLLKN